LTCTPPFPILMDTARGTPRGVETVPWNLIRLTPA